MDPNNTNPYECNSSKPMCSDATLQAISDPQVSFNNNQMNNRNPNDY